MTNESENADLGGLIFDAAEANDPVVAASIIRGTDFIVFQQINMEDGEIEEDGEGNFSVVLAEVDEDDIAVVCFSNKDAANDFAAGNTADIPAGRSLPSVVLDGNDLLDGLPADCGLLVNPGSEHECYFPAGCL